MSFSQAWLQLWKRADNFTGTASRTEYWWNALVNSVIIPIWTMICYWILLSTSGFVHYIDLVPVIVLSIYDLGVIAPGYAELCRRYHDAGMPAWAAPSYLIIKAILDLILWVTYIRPCVWVVIRPLIKQPWLGAFGSYWKMLIPQAGPIGMILIGLVLYLILKIANLIILATPNKHIDKGV